MEQGLAAGEREPLGVRLDLGEDRRIGGVEEPGEVLGQARMPERVVHDGARSLARCSGALPLWF
jgi:hypothetical protein